jgi:hypothetical protein
VVLFVRKVIFWLSWAPILTAVPNWFPFCKIAPAKYEAV